MLVFISALLLSLSTGSNPDTIRLAYHELDSEKSIDTFIELVDDSGVDSLIPYKASALMQKADYVTMPWKKLSYFNSGKKMLEDFISRFPDNVEARYVRFLVQSQAPGFLGYKNNIQADAEFVKTHLDNCDLQPQYKQVLIKNINTYIKNPKP